MQQPTTKVVNEALDALEVLDRALTPAPELARQAVAKWRSDAERDRLPVTNQTTGSGAPLLKVDEVIRKSYPNHAGKR